MVNRDNKKASLFESNTPFPIASSSSPNPDYFESPSNDPPLTPKECIFDPFAPGLDDMALAPMSKKLTKDSRNLIPHRLDFKDHDGDVETFSKAALMESDYGTLLEAIVMKHKEMFLVEKYHPQSTDLDLISSPSQLSGVSFICPDAPMKPTARKSMNIDLGLCRKLEF
ncbi:hypothetical protein Nepgr_030529 [Nepenthes gracilis]|uniref:Uncharacterized protein n=1 Tax=Nepenthes gracilis TaxID=150966 RepID=A0AAD3TGU0_NEPGR|nr:hypothetical protein Nepgr_030529 [Nepenthes gracilis]